MAAAATTREQAERYGYRQSSAIPPQSEAERRLADLIAERTDPEQTRRGDLEKLWSLGRAFTQGNQWVRWEERSRRLRRVPCPQHVIRETRNLMRTSKQRKVASMTAFQPEFVALPASNDIEDVQAAQIAEDVVRHYYRALRMRFQNKVVAGNAVDTGTGFYGLEWDPSRGEFYADGPVGDFAVSSPTPFEIYVDPHARCDDDVWWMIHKSRVSMQWVDQHFPEKAKHVRSTLQKEQGRDGVQAAYSQGQMHEQIDDRASRHWTTRYIMYERPNRVHHKGRLVVQCGEVICHSGPNPMPDGGFPWIPVRKIIVEDSFWGATETWDEIKVQVNYNRLHSKWLEWQYKVGFATTLLHDGKTPEAQFHNGIQMIPYRGAQPPQWMEPPRLGNEVDKQLGRAEHDYDRLSGISGAEQGIYQGKISGDAYEVLVEQSMQNKIPSLDEMKDALEQWARKLLMLAQKYVTEERTLKIVGKDNTISYRSFKGSDLRGNYDIIIKAESMVPRSEAITRKQVADMVGAGLLNMQDPHDKAVAWKMIGLRDPTYAEKIMNEQEERAERENKLAERGLPIPEHAEWEDLDTHIRVHGQKLLSEDFESWDDEAKLSLILHYQQTVEKALPKAGATLPEGALMGMEAGMQPQPGPPTQGAA